MGGPGRGAGGIGAGALDDARRPDGSRAVGRIRVASVARIVNIGGDENRLLQTALAFDRDRIDQVVLILDPVAALSEDEQRRWNDMLAAYADARIEVVDLSVGLPRSGAGRNARLLRRLTREFRARNIEVVDARMGQPVSLCLPAARAARVPIVTFTAYYTSLFDPPFRYLIGQAAVGGVDAVISDAQATLDDFAGWRWNRSADLALIQNGIQPATSSLSREDARAALGLPTDPSTRIIGQISRIEPRKAFDVFIRAAELVHRSEPDVVFAAIGFVPDDKVEYLRGLEALRDELGLRERLHFVTYPGPVGDAYRAIDVFAHLSRKDSSPFAIHEGMSAGKPSVISALPGNLELVADGETGLLVPPEDPQATAEAMLRFLREPELAQRLGAGAAQRFQDRHLPERMAAAHVGLYERLLAAKR